MRWGLKGVVVFFLTVLILIPLGMVNGLIAERERYRREAVASVARSHAGAQAVIGPVLVVPYTETVEVEETDARGEPRRVLRERSGQWTYFPEVLVLEGRLTPGTRKRGLHEVRVYELQGQLSARFDAAIPADADPLRPRRIGQPWLGYGFADVRGLTGAPRLQVNGMAATLEQGLGSREGGGIHARLAAPRAGERLALDARLAFALGGTESLAVVPLARANTVRLQSAWPHPSFGGSFLPRTRRVGADGFRAEWEVSSLATTAQAQYRAGVTAVTPVDGERAFAPQGAPAALDALGVSLVDPVDVYAQADRASKYGLLFIVLTFTGFFLFELIRRQPIHPIQYGLVGLALAIFFLLLLGLSEHIAFGLAYLAAAAACIGLLGFYLAHVLHSRARGLAFAAMLGALYAALYGLLVSEDNALVLGSGLLFAILAAVMIVTRKVDWYRLGQAREAL